MLSSCLSGWLGLGLLSSEFRFPGITIRSAAQQNRNTESEIIVSQRLGPRCLQAPTPRSGSTLSLAGGSDPIAQIKSTQHLHPF